MSDEVVVGHPLNHFVVGSVTASEVVMLKYDTWVCEATLKTPLIVH